MNVYEHWETQGAVEAFRGRGPADDQGAAIGSASRNTTSPGPVS